MLRWVYLHQIIKAMTILNLQFPSLPRNQMIPHSLYTLTNIKTFHLEPSIFNYSYIKQKSDAQIEIETTSDLPSHFSMKTGTFWCSLSLDYFQMQGLIKCNQYWQMHHFATQWKKINMSSKAKTRAWGQLPGMSIFMIYTGDLLAFFIKKSSIQIHRRLSSIIFVIALTSFSLNRRRRITQQINFYGLLLSCRIFSSTSWAICLRQTGLLSLSQISKKGRNWSMVRWLAAFCSLTWHRIKGEVLCQLQMYCCIKDVLTPEVPTLRSSSCQSSIFTKYFPSKVALQIVSYRDAFIMQWQVSGRSNFPAMPVFSPAPFHLSTTRFDCDCCSRISSMNAVAKTIWVKQ